MYISCAAQCEFINTVSVQCRASPQESTNVGEKKETDPSE